MGDVKRRHLELVGLLVTSSDIAKMYHIDYLYKIDIEGCLVGRAIQRGFDWDLHVPFWDIVLNLSNAYAPAVEKRWIRRRDVTLEVLMSFKYGQTPGNVGMGDGWVMDCER